MRSTVFVLACLCASVCLRDDALIWINTARGWKSVFDQAKLKEHLCSQVMISPLLESQNIRIIMGSLAAESRASSYRHNSENRYLLPLSCCCKVSDLWAFRLVFEMENNFKVICANHPHHCETEQSTRKRLHK